MKGYLFILLVSFGIICCVDPFRIHGDFAQHPQLVVNAILTDEVGPQFISLFNSVNVYEDYRKPQPYVAKSVTVLNDRDEEFIFHEIEPGLYASDSDFSVVHGIKYRLHVDTYQDGVYESSEEMIQPSGAIDSLFLKVRVFKPLNYKTQYFADIYINSKISDAGSAYLKWGVKYTYRVQTLPEPPLCCAECWVTDYEETVQLSDNRFISNGRILKTLVATIPLSNSKLIDKIKLVVDQHGISEPVFIFWKTVQDQQQGLTSLFQPTVGTAPSNIYKLGSSEKALGIFYVKSSVKKELIITHSDISKFATLPAENLVRGSCLKYKNSTTTKPDGWD